MAAKRTMTLNLTDPEMQALDALSERKDMSKTAVLRHGQKRLDASPKGGEAAG
jgi:hypothetical protein